MALAYEPSIINLPLNCSPKNYYKILAHLPLEIQDLALRSYISELEFYLDPSSLFDTVATFPHLSGIQSKTALRKHRLWIKTVRHALRTRRKKLVRRIFKLRIFSTSSPLVCWGRISNLIHTNVCVQKSAIGSIVFYFAARVPFFQEWSGNIRSLRKDIPTSIEKAVIVAVAINTNGTNSIRTYLRKFIGLLQFSTRLRNLKTTAIPGFTSQSHHLRTMEFHRLWTCPFSQNQLLRRPSSLPAGIHLCRLPSRTISESRWAAMLFREAQQEKQDTRLSIGSRSNYRNW